MMDNLQFGYHLLNGDFDPRSKQMEAAVKTIIEEIILYGGPVTDFSNWDFSDDEWERVRLQVEHYFNQ